ncbi:MAG: hypothetical protein ABIK09_01465 [Pseudomonadota bacterium]
MRSSSPLSSVFPLLALAFSLASASCDGGASEPSQDPDVTQEDVGPGCTPDCAGKQCGDDGCGGTCGDCPSPEVCGGDFTCVCLPDCGIRECGPDPICGVLCGSCEGGDACFDGLCGACGVGTCGGDCGACAVGSRCVIEAAAVFGSCVPCDPSECGTECGPCPEGLECIAGTCSGEPLQTCTDLVLCIAYCDEIDDACMDACYALAGPDALQDMTGFLDCSTEHCGGLPSGEYNPCVEQQCTEKYLECMTGDGSCVDFMPCLFDCTDAFELSGEKSKEDAYDYCFIECNVQMTLEDQKANVAFLGCLMETCPDVTEECLDEAFGIGGLCYPVLQACKGSTELCEVSLDCPPEKYCLYQGCIQDLCDQGLPLCDDGDAYQCADDGSAMTLADECGLDEDCSDGACVSMNSCAGDDDCAASEHCALDSCVPDLCDQGTTYCEDGDVYVCNVNGSTEIKMQECGAQPCEAGACQ